MPTKTENQFLYKDVNMMRYMGLIFLVISPVFFLLVKFGAFSSLASGLVKLLAWLFVAISVAMILFSPNMTVLADKTTRTLRIQYGTIFRQTKTIPFDDIADIQSQAGVNSRRADTRGYRLVVVLKDGKIFPLRNYFNRHENKKQAAVDLRFAVTGSRHSDVPPVDSAGISLTI